MMTPEAEKPMLRAPTLGAGSMPSASKSTVDE